jgi:phenylalanyl-tRNA synthetase beta chain
MPGDGVRLIEHEPPLVLDAATAGEALVAVVPPHRLDLAIEADISEEIARVRGYETLAGRLPETPMPGYRADPRRLVDEVRDILAAAGLTELVTHGLIGPDDHASLGHGADDPVTIRALNPVTADHAELRRSLLPEHLRVVGENERQRNSDVQAFEIGALHAWQDGRPAEREVLGLILAGREQPLTHDRPAWPMDVAFAKGLLELVALRVVGSRLHYEPVAAHEGVEHPGRIASVIATPVDGGHVPVGRVGELHPRLLERYEVRAGHVVFSEIDLAVLLDLAPQRTRVGRLERVPGVERDIALVVPTQQPAGGVEALIRAHGGELLREVRLFDVYVGPPLDEGHKSLAFRLRFEPVEAVSTDEDVDAAVVRVVAVLSERIGARLRA